MLFFLSIPKTLNLIQLLHKISILEKFRPWLLYPKYLVQLVPRAFRQCLLGAYLRRIECRRRRHQLAVEAR